jgi:SsrA-binding protein
MFHGDGPFAGIDVDDVSVVKTNVKVPMKRLVRTKDRVEGGEVWLYGLEIPEYVQANQLNHKPKRRRKMLLNREEIDRFATKTTLKGSTLVPLEIYFRKGIAKIMLAVGHGKKLHDKRETLKKNEAKREIHRAMSRKRRGD